MEKTISLSDGEEALAVFGRQDRHLKRIRKTLKVRLVARQNRIVIEGPDDQVAKAAETVDLLRQIYSEQNSVLDDDVESTLDSVVGTHPSVDKERLEVIAPGKIVRARTPGQQHYIETMQAGDIEAKVNPYLRPLYDALNETMGVGNFKRYVDNDVIEVIPLAFMRGRTLNNSMIILDEAQNTTHVQMKMFLTRLGVRSKMVVTGDTSQPDLPPGQISGLVDAKNILRDVTGVRFVHLTSADVVRHRMVQNVVNAYDDADRAAHEKSSGAHRRSGER